MLSLLLTHTVQDYGVDGLAHGLASLGQLIDWPNKPTLHGRNVQPYYPKPFDLPEHGWDASRIVDGLRSCVFDVVVIADMSQSTLALVHSWSDHLYQSRERVVFYDGGDERDNRFPIIQTVLGFTPVVHFKRELPIGATWAIPLAFGFPEERIPLLEESNRYGASLIAAAYPHRQQVAEALRNIPEVTISLSSGYHDRLNITQFEGIHRQSLIGISPSGDGWGNLPSGPGWHTYRHLEIAAYGCCPVLDYPTVLWRDGFRDGVECCYFKDDIANIVTDLLHEPGRARSIGLAARQSIIDHHTTRNLAKRVVATIHGADA